MKFILLVMLVVFSLYGKNIKQDVIEKLELVDGTTILRVHFDYLNSFENIKRIRGLDGYYNLNFPLPNKWEVIDVNGYIKYTPSVLLLKDLSSAMISFNDVVVKQFKIFTYQNSGIKFQIDPYLLHKNNKLQFEVIQHYTYKCEDGTNSSLWSDIDLSKSYIELHVRPHAIKEMVSSIKTDVFDDKQYTVTPLNYVMQQKDENTLKNFALFSTVASTNLKYRLEKIKVSNKLDLKNHNLIISTKEKAKKILSILDNKYITDETPSLSMFFNSEGCNPWLNKNSFATIKADDGIKITDKGALFEKSLYLNKAKITLTDLQIQNSDAVTVAFWFKPQDSRRSVLFGFKNYSLMIFDNYIGFNTANKDLFGAKYKFKNNRWYHLTATFHNKEVDRNSIIIDDKVLSMRQISNDYISDNAKLTQEAYIGASGNTEKMLYKGYIDQFYMFDHAISSISAKKLYRYSIEHKKNRITESIYLDDKLAHDINVIQNPYSVDKAIIVLAPEDESRQRELIYALYKNDIEMYNRQGLDIIKTTIPKKAKAYSAKDFLPLDKKIYFKELGYKTKLLKGRYPPKINLKFKVYPDNYFDSKDKIKTNIHYILPSVVNKDSVINTYINGVFADQIDIIKATQESKISIAANKLFNFDDVSDMPAYLIGKGFNEFRIDFSLIPIKKGSCNIFNTENLVASVLDDSYIVLPSAKKWIELPYMQLITNAQYPYSIYPDLQDTVIYLANDNYKTISSAMDFVFFLTQELGSYPNYLKITTTLSDEDKEKNIIVFGTIYDEKLQKLSKNAPVMFDKEMMKKDYPYIKRFIEHKTIINEDRVKKYRFKTSMQETNFIDNTMIMQMFRSNFNSDKTILMFSANTPKCLDKGVTSILKYKNRNNILGDMVIYNFEEEEGISYNIKDKYILSKLGWIETLSLKIGANPVVYIIVFIILLIIFVWIVSTLLRKFKEEHHKDAE